MTVEARPADQPEIVEHVRSRLHGSGFVTTVVPARGHSGRPSVVAGPAESPTLVLNGHLDTVGVAGMSEPFAPRRDGDRLLGHGADMKGGVAAVVAAAEHLVATKAPVRPVLALVADEEDASPGSAAVIDALPGLGSGRTPA